MLLNNLPGISICDKTVEADDQKHCKTTNEHVKAVGVVGRVVVVVDHALEFVAICFRVIQMHHVFKDSVLSQRHDAVGWLVSLNHPEMQAVLLKADVFAVLQC